MGSSFIAPECSPWQSFAAERRRQLCCRLSVTSLCGRGFDPGTCKVRTLPSHNSSSFRPCPPTSCSPLRASSLRLLLLQPALRQVVLQGVRRQVDDGRPCTVRAWRRTLARHRACMRGEAEGKRLRSESHEEGSAALAKLPPHPTPIQNSAPGPTPSTLRNCLDPPPPSHPHPHTYMRTCLPSHHTPPHTHEHNNLRLGCCIGVAKVCIQRL